MPQGIMRDFCNARAGRMRRRPAARQAYVPESDMEKLQSTIKQFVREWGSDGAAELRARGLR